LKAPENATFDAVIKRPRRRRRKKSKSRRPAPQPDQLVYRVDEVRRMGGPGRTKVYELAAAGKLRLVRVDGMTRVDGDSLRTLLREGCE
jgi:hypothetical protein